MSNRLIAVFMALGVLAASNAFASRAQDLVLGTGDAGVMLNGGSLYYDTNYNIFYNPAYVNDFKNWATIEKSNFPGSTAEGGFVASMNNFAFGAFFNRGNAIIANNSNAYATGGVLGSPTNNGWTVFPTRPLDIFFGGDMGVKWGLGLTYAQNATAAGDSSALVLHGGLEFMGLEPFINVEAMGSDVPGNSHSFIQGGLRYHWGEWVPYLAFLSATDSMNTVNTAVAPNTTINNNHETTIGGGLGRSTKIAEGVRLNYALSYWSVADNYQTRSILPIDLSVEGDALSWLTLRAGTSYHLIDKAAGVNFADNTTGRLGATAHISKVDFDFAVGNSLATNETANLADAQAFSIGNDFFTAASLTYHW